MDWMYIETNLASSEDYLLGRRVEKNYGKNKSNSFRETFGIGSGSTSATNDNVQVDLQNKLMEDPLVAIRQKEYETRKELLKNPVLLQHLKKKLEKKQLMERLKEKNDIRDQDDKRNRDHCERTHTKHKKIRNELSAESKVESRKRAIEAVSRIDTNKHKEKHTIKTVPVVDTNKRKEKHTIKTIPVVDTNKCKEKHAIRTVHAVDTNKRKEKHAIKTVPAVDTNQHKEKHAIKTVPAVDTNKRKKKHSHNKESKKNSRHNLRDKDKKVLKKDHLTSRHHSRLSLQKLSYHSKTAEELKQRSELLTSWIMLKLGKMNHHIDVPGLLKFLKRRSAKKVDIKVKELDRFHTRKCKVSSQKKKSKHDSKKKIHSSEKLKKHKKHSHSKLAINHKDKKTSKEKKTLQKKKKSRKL